jgi:hypothetical protein
MRRRRIIMNRFLRWWAPSPRGAVVLGDYALIASVMILGSVVGLALVRNALLNETASASPPIHSSVLFSRTAR